MKKSWEQKIISDEYTLGKTEQLTGQFYDPPLLFERHFFYATTECFNKKIAI